MDNICWPNSYKNYLLSKFSSLVQEHLYESHSYFQYSRRYDLENFKRCRPLRDHFSIFWHFWVPVGLFWSTWLCWPNVFQINLTWKFTSRGTENVFESCSYLQYSRSYNQKNFECYSPLRDTSPYEKFLSNLRINTFHWLRNRNRLKIWLGKSESFF